jgi:very-short-patch-repair endonuclease
MKRKILPYNPALKELARKLRKNMTFSEVKIWDALKDGNMLEYDFDRQKPIGNYIVDFYCKDLMLAIEIDGITHSFEDVCVKDANRQKELEWLGVNFLRFNALQVVNDITNVCRAIECWIIDFEEKHSIPDHILKKRNKGTS